MRTLITAMTLVLATTTAMAQNADDKAIRQYDLSMDKVAHYDAGARALEAAMQKDPTLMADRQKMGREFADSPAALKMRLNRHPRVLAFFTAEKLSLDDAALIPTALSNACHADESPGLAKVLVYSEDQLKFCKDNRGALHKLRIFAPVRPTPMKK